MKNNSRNIVFCTALATLVVSMMMVPVGFAAIGVKKGDWAKYNYEFVSEIAGEGIEETKKTGQIKFKVEDVSDMTVILETAFYYDGNKITNKTDGTEMGFIIEANLTEGEEVIAPIFEEAGVPLHINGTESKEYAGVTREVNYVDYADIKIERDNESIDLNLYKTYWDKATGFLCETSMLMSIEIGEGKTLNMSFLVKMTENSMWGTTPFTPQWWLWPIIALIIIVVAGSAVMLLRGKKAKRAHSK